MMEKVRNLKIGIEVRKRDVAVVLGWSIAIALILIKAHQLFVLDNPQLAVYKRAYVHYLGASFTDFDRLLLVAISFLVGMFLVEIKSLVYAYFASMFLSFSFGVIYVFLYVWFTLGYGETLSQVAFGWEWAVWLALINVFRFMVPIGILFSLLGVVTGNFVRIWLKP